MGQHELPAEDLAALREAILGLYEDDTLQFPVAQPTGRAPRASRRPQGRPRWLKLSVLLLIVLLVNLVRAVVTGRARRAVVLQQRAVSLYRQFSGRDPRVAEAEVRRIMDQLKAIDQQGRPDRDRSGTVGAADQAELEAAADALLAYHLAGRQSEDALLGQIQAAWVEYEALQQQVQERLLRAWRGTQAARAEFTRQQQVGLVRQQQATMDRYLAGWRTWLDRHTRQGGSPDRDG